MPHVEWGVPVRRVTQPPAHHHFGYYDKFPWDSTGRYLLSLETAFMDRPPTPDDAATIGMVDVADGYRWIPLARTVAWNWQQGTMLQWLETAPDRLIIYNAREGERYVSVIQDVHTGEKRTLPRPVYAVSRGGRSAVTVTFPRVHACYPGYGYIGIPDPWHDDPAPGEDGIYWMDLETGRNRRIVSFAQIVASCPQPMAKDMKHHFNHLQFNTDDSRFLFLHRWGKGGPWEATRLFTAAPDGSDVFCVADHEMVSHFDWRDETRILAWARQHGEGDHYYLFTDRTREREMVGPDVLTCDGHCSYSPDRRWILTDTYPDHRHLRTLILYRPEDNLRIDIGRFLSPPELQGEIRCDLHPRWSRDGMQVCFDSMHEGSRQVYVAEMDEVLRKFD